MSETFNFVDEAVHYPNSINGKKFDCILEILEGTVQKRLKNEAFYLCVHILKGLSLERLQVLSGKGTVHVVVEEYKGDVGIDVYRDLEEATVAMRTRKDDMGEDIQDNWSIILSEDIIVR